MKVAAIIPSAGKGSRMGFKKKNYLPLLGKPVLAHTIERFEECGLIGSVIIAAPQDDISFTKNEIVEKYGFKKVSGIVAGGAERQDSVANALYSIEKENYDIILVHDGARPLVTAGIIKEAILKAKETGAAIVAVPVKDTIKEALGGFVKKTVQRENLWSVQTPQAFRADILLKAHRAAAKEGHLGTDESSLVEKLGEKVAIVRGSYENIKITTDEDLFYAERVLEARSLLK